MPTDPADDPASFGLVLEGFQLPGASSPRDLRVAASSPDSSTMRSSTSSSRSSARRRRLSAGTCSKRWRGCSGSAATRVPPFPIEQLPAQGARALGAWLEGIVATTVGRSGSITSRRWSTGRGSGTRSTLTLGALDASLRLGLRAEPGPTGTLVLTATLGADVGGPLEAGALEARAEARAEVPDRPRHRRGARAAVARLWASIGRQDGVGPRVLDVDDPTVARADRCDSASGSTPSGGSRSCSPPTASGSATTRPTLDLTTPDAVMDAVGNAVEDVAAELLGQLGRRRRRRQGAARPGGAAWARGSADDRPRRPARGSARRGLRLLADTPRRPRRCGARRCSGSFATQSPTPPRPSPDRRQRHGPDPWRIRLIGPFDLEAHSRRRHAQSSRSRPAPASTRSASAAP